MDWNKNNIVIRTEVFFLKLFIDYLDSKDVWQDIKPAFLRLSIVKIVAIKAKVI